MMMIRQSEITGSHFILGGTTDIVLLVILNIWNWVIFVNNIKTAKQTFCLFDTIIHKWYQYESQFYSRIINVNWSCLMKKKAKMDVPAN